MRHIFVLIKCERLPAINVRKIHLNPVQINIFLSVIFYADALFRSADADASSECWLFATPPSRPTIVVAIGI